MTLPPHDRYIWQKQLQKSIFGEIQLAHDNHTNTFVAIKLSRIDSLDNPPKEVVEDPRQEVQIINYVNSQGIHQNVIDVLETFQTNEYECTVLPYCPKGDLFERVGTLSEVEMFCAFQQIVNGVHHIHSKGIAHLDLSLENVLINDSGFLKICDFGLARKWSDPCGRVGKLFYMAPEIVYPDLQGDKYDCRMADMYSLGVCLFIMHTGFQPYEKPTEHCRSFVVLMQHGARALLDAYGVANQVPEKILELLEVLICPLHKRANLQELLALLSNSNSEENVDVDEFFNCDQNFNPSDFSCY